MHHCKLLFPRAVLWQPSAEVLSNSHMARYMKQMQSHTKGATTYAELHRWSVDHPEQFWPSIVDYSGIKFRQKPQSILQHGESIERAKWFVGAELNFAENLLRGSADEQKVALKARAEYGVVADVTYAELRTAVARLASSLKACGVQKGDRVAGCVTNGAEAVIGMLATTSVGAIWSSCSPDFGPQGILDRFGQVLPKVLITVDEYYYNGKRLDVCHKIAAVAGRLGDQLSHIVVIAKSNSNPNLASIPKHILWDDFLDRGTPALEFVSTAFNHPVYIMFSSGTTGTPKCITHGAGGVLLQHMKELLLHTNLQQTDTIFYHTTCGWMMWNWMVSSLACNSTVLLYDGAAMHPTPTQFFDLLEQEQVHIFGTSAKYLAAAEKAHLEPVKTHNLEHLRAILSTGSVLAESQYDWVYMHVHPNVQLASISGGTDIVSCFALGNPTMPVRRGELQCKGLGMAVEVFNSKGESVTGEKGELVCTRPFPVQPVKFWNDPDGVKYHRAYFAKWPNTWVHGDYAEATPDGGLVIHGRSDAILNPKGVRIGTAEIYRVVDTIEEIMESIAVGQQIDGDERIVLFVRMRPPHKMGEALEGRVRRELRRLASPNHVPAKILGVTDIPRTASGKITEIAVRDIVNGRVVNNLEAISNPECLKEYKDRPELQC